MFLSKRDDGDFAEGLVLDLFESVRLPCIKNEDRSTLTHYDLMCPDFKVEVKYDKYSVKSGNLVVEIHNTKSDKPSGLMATIAELWCYVLPTTQGHHEIWMGGVDALKDFVERNQPDRHLTKAGDNNSEIYLYTKDSLLKGALFDRFDDMDKKFVIPSLYSLADKEYEKRNKKT